MAGARTALLGVIGWPVAHSRSPAMHNAALAALGEDLIYVAFAVPPEKFAAAIAGAAALGVRGLNVTIPHKEAALALCVPDERARAVGAVNTLSFEDGAIRGTNTDVYGFEKLLEESGADARGRAVILGAGGAARAAASVLLPTAARVTVVSRGGRAITIAGVTTDAAKWPDDPRALFSDCDLLVDATPRGLTDATPRGLTDGARGLADAQRGIADATPREPGDATPREPDAAPRDRTAAPASAAADAALDLSSLPAHATVLDLVVRRETALTRAARERGLRALAGAPMLLHQGAAALERWLGRPAPLDVMRAALTAALE